MSDRRRPTSGDTRRGGSGTTAWRRPIRSTASRGARPSPSARRSAARAGSSRAPVRGSRRGRAPGRAASTRRVVAASSGRYGSAWKLVIRLSRPNSAMNHGRPAAGSVAPSLMSGGRRSAPRSLRLARYVRSNAGSLAERAGASASHRSSSLDFAAAHRVEAVSCPAQPERRGRCAASGVIVSAVVHCSPGASSGEYVNRLWVMRRGPAGGDRHGSTEAVALVGERHRAIVLARRDRPRLNSSVLDFEDVSEIRIELEASPRSWCSRAGG